MKYRHLKDTIFDSNNGETICLCCARVIEERTPEYARPEINDKKNKIHFDATTPEHHDYALSTKFTSISSDFKGDSISYQNQKLFYKLKTLDNYSPVGRSDSRKTHLINLLQNFQLISKKLQLPETIKTGTVSLLRKLARSGISQGRRAREFVSATVYVIFRQFNSMISQDELCQKLDISKSKLKKYVYLIMMTLDIRIHVGSIIDTILFDGCSKLGLSKPVIDKSFQLVKKCQELGLSGGKYPKLIAAAAAYVSAINLQKNHIETENFCNAFSVNEASLYATKRELKPACHALGLRHTNSTRLSMGSLLQ